MIFFTRPISAVFMALAILSILRGVWLLIKSPAPEVALAEDDA
jgi:TctA family transporter